MVRQRSKKSTASTTAEVSTAANMLDLNGLRVGSPGSWSVQTQWIFFAIASGACAAFNGVFAKLTTTELTTTLSNAIAGALGLSSVENIVEYVVRAMFFGLNLAFNGVMWSLFTTALARGNSTTQVSIMNTSTNFLFTAILGLMIFSESLQPLWWGGAVFLVAGSVIVGRNDESKDAAAAEGGYAPVAPFEDALDDEAEGTRRRKSDDEDEDVVDLGDLAAGQRTA